MSETATLSLDRRYRLVTRSDFDGLVCAMLLKELGMVSDILFVHPKDVQDGVIDIGPDDILTNLPYDPRAHLVFDHHASEIARNGIPAANHVIVPDAPSAARVVYEYYGGEAQLHSVPAELMQAVDQADARAAPGRHSGSAGLDAAQFPDGRRTGLGRFRTFRVELPAHDGSDRQLRGCRPTSAGRFPTSRNASSSTATKTNWRRRSAARDGHGKLVVLDLRERGTIQPGNRFMIYALYPECEVSLHVLGAQAAEHRLRVGKSILVAAPSSTSAR